DARLVSDWSSDVCSSDLQNRQAAQPRFRFCFFRRERSDIRPGISEADPALPLVDCGLVPSCFAAPFVRFAFLAGAPFLVFDRTPVVGFAPGAGFTPGAGF